MICASQSSGTLSLTKRTESALWRRVARAKDAAIASGLTRADLAARLNAVAGEYQGLLLSVWEQPHTRGSWGSRRARGSTSLNRSWRPSPALTGPSRCLRAPAHGPPVPGQRRLLRIIRPKCRPSLCVNRSRRRLANERLRQPTLGVGCSPWPLRPALPALRRPSRKVAAEPTCGARDPPYGVAVRPDDAGRGGR
jgi:hypothetical protein